MIPGQWKYHMTALQLYLGKGAFPYASSVASVSVVDYHDTESVVWYSRRVTYRAPGTAEGPLQPQPPRSALYEGKLAGPDLALFINGGKGAQPRMLQSSKEQCGNGSYKHASSDVGATEESRRMA